MKLNLYILMAFFLSSGLYAQTITEIVVNSDDHNTLETAVIAAELDDDLNGDGPFTLFAPTDAAFAALGSVVDDLLLDPTGDLADILLYHVLAGETSSFDITSGMLSDPLNDANTLKFTSTTSGSVYANQALVTMSNIQASNGVVHVIDAVLLPVETVVDVAIDNGFSTLTLAVIRAELLPALTDPSANLTVFAPTDGAFAEIQTTVNQLLQDPTGELKNVLLYHVLGSEVFAADLSDGQSAETLQGNNISVGIAGTTVSINDAEVTQADIDVDNGVVHVIDAVLVPSVSSTQNISAQEAGIVAYPNPTNNELNISFESDLVGEKMIRFYNALGQEVYNAQQVDQNATINLSDLSNGLYHMIIEVENGNSYFQKITVQR